LTEFYEIAEDGCDGNFFSGYTTFNDLNPKVPSDRGQCTVLYMLYYLTCRFFSKLSPKEVKETYANPKILLSQKAYECLNDMDYDLQLPTVSFINKVCKGKAPIPD
jgi:hypothetical protein